MNKQRGDVNLHLVLTIFLGLGMVLFGVLAILAYRDNTFIHNNLDDLNKQAATRAAAQQKHDDDIANAKANENPFRTYVSQPQDGSFKLEIPKNWSIYAAHFPTSSVTQLELSANLDAINENRAGGAINTQALHIFLKNQSPVDVVRTYESNIKKKILTSKSVTVSGISGTRLEGIIDAQRHNGVVVVLPVRDKTMVIATENRESLAEFDRILSTAKIIP